MLIGARQSFLYTESLPYESEIEYLQTDGSQYVETGISITSKYTIEITVQLDNKNVYQCLWSARNATTQQFKNSLTLFCTNTGTQGRFDYRDISYFIEFSDWTNTHTYKSNKHELYIDDNLVYSASASRFIPESTVKIFGAQYLASDYISYMSTGKLYKFRIFNASGNPVIDLVPYRQGSTGFLYDKINGHLLGNSGSGSFILGPDKQI